jgi:hypothetical protein
MMLLTPVSLSARQGYHKPLRLATISHANNAIPKKLRPFGGRPRAACCEFNSTDIRSKQELFAFSRTN